MSSEQLYYLTEPTEWATAPSVYSYSSLMQIENCPLAWQLQNSRYHNFDRYPTRPNPASVEGEIIHWVIERLFRELAKHGMPPIGSEIFQASVKKLGIAELISQLASDHLIRIGEHPRGAGFRLQSSVQEIHNKVIRIFRQQYDKIRKNTPPTMIRALQHSPDNLALHVNSTKDYRLLLEKQGVLTELSLRHPDLPFKGVIDFVWLEDDGAELTDFKSGAAKSEHHEQVLLYALLWEKNTGQLPINAYIVYPDSIVQIQMNREIIDGVHKRLVKRVSDASIHLSEKPARAKINESCKYCQVRQMCDTFWQHGVERPTNSNFVDAQIVVNGTPADFGFIGSLPDGNLINVVYDKEIARICGPFVEGKTLRIIGGLCGDDALEIKSWTEVFHR